MEAPELYSQHARVWLPDAVEVWRSAELRRGFSPGDRALALRLEDGTEVEHTVDLQTGGLPPLRNPDLLVGENDLTTLSFLHEPAVLHNLRVRFIDSKLIYTYCGIVLVAINPYDSLAIYDTDIIGAYSGQNMGDMDPHIFAVAEEAFKHMARCERNQSIIVSGESGAGKTVSAKYVMRYFAAVSRSSAEANVEEKVLASNPIMEAIGNAKTTRNDNSSRFGKYIEIGFNKKNCMIGAKMKTYLLEKSRVVFQAQGERNYHIFYQLCASSHLPEFQALKLGCADDFHCANQGQSPEIDGVDDARDMSVTRRALSLLGFSNSDQSALFQILAGILHLSNVEVNGQTADSCRIVPDQEPLVLFSGLMGVPHTDMAHWLCHRKLKTTAETYVKTLSRENAVNGRDALAKHIYARIFNWIVDHINRTLTFVAAQRSFIGVLDIYGFETFDINSFEQFCINYANEKLQQQFNLHVFKLEQEEYMKEQIPWSLIDFYDNEPYIKLIEAKMGVLDLLDEECKMPKASDDTWAQKLYSSLLKQNVHFDKPRLSNRAFIIHHFADKVEYQCDGFLEKNKDTVNEDQINVLKTSKFDLVLKLLQEDEATTGSKGCSSKRERPGKVLRDHKKTVGLQFRQSLHSLMETLNATTPHYVRCIKPNDQKAPFTLDPVRTVQQLRSCGILETIRISAAGFPSRWTYQEFFSRYRVLMKRKEVLPDYKQSCKIALEKLVKDRDQYQFGKNKIFFRAGQVAFLENLRSEKLRSACVCIQKTMRCWLARKKYLRMRESAVTIQKHVRAHQARCYVKFVRWTKAAVIIQQYFRMWAARRSYRRQQFAAVTIQSCFRAYKAKQNYYKLVFEQKTVVIQKWVRGWLARRHFGRVLAAVVLLQSCVRRRRAREALRQLKVEARSVEHFKKLNVGMENKIMQLQRKNDEQHQANRELSVKLRAVEKTQAAEREKLLRAEQQSSAKAERVSGLLEQLSFLHRELETNRREKEERDRAHQEHTEKMEAELNARNSLLITEKEDLSRRIQEQAKQITDTKVILENTKQVEKDLTEERSRYQSLLSEYLQLEQRHAELKEKMNQYKREDKAGHKKTELTVVRMRRTSVQSSDEQESPAKREDVKQPAVDMPILLKLQRRLKELETVNRSLQRQLERRTEVQQEKAKVIEEQKSLNRAELDLEALKRQELESENKRLKLDLNMLRKSLSGENRALAPPKPDSLSYSVLLEQLDSSNEELEMRKEEVMLLRSHMVRQEALKHKDSLTEGLKLNLSEMSLLQDIERSTDLHTLNEDGELWLAYEGLKETNRLLEGQLQEQGQQHREECEELQKELQKVKEQNLQQQQLLTKSLQLPQDAQIEARLQHEITRLANENLDHMERQESQDKTINNLKKQLKTYAKRLEEFEAGARKQSTVSQIGIPVSITRKEKEFQGMLEYKQGDESLLLKNLVVDLKPRGVAVSFIPGLPAYIIFMCIRYADYIDDEDRVSTLLNSTIISIKGVIKRRGADFETVSFWLANTCRFLHCLKQYSGDEDFTKHNTPRQNEHCLANFELSGYQQVFGDLAIQIYQQLIKCTEELLQPLIVAAMLEHETVQGVLGSRPTGLRKRSASLQDEGGVTVETLLQQLNVFHSAMIQHGMDPELVKQVVKQVFHIICGMTLNNLVLRKDMCSWGKGLQIRYKVWQLEEWLSEKELADCGARDTLEPLIQAAQLLQIKKKTEADAQAICTMCSALTAAQIVKVLNLYTPVIEFEERVSNTFIAIIEELLKDRRESPALMMDVKTLFPVSLPFSPSLVTLDSIQIPISLNLSFLTRV